MFLRDYEWLLNYPDPGVTASATERVGSNMILHSRSKLWNLKNSQILNLPFLSTHSVNPSTRLISRYFFVVHVYRLLTYFHEIRRGRFGQQASKTNGNGNAGLNQPKGTGSQNSSPTAPYAPAMPPLNTSASFASTGGSETNSPQVENQVQDVEPTKFFFREKYARLGVKGNFMPLAAQPKNVDLGEWLAHQCKNLGLGSI